jgi:hypothetical protein
MNVPGTNGGSLPDVNAKWLVTGSAVTTIAVWVASLDAINVPATVASALTTLIAVGLGLWQGDNSRNRRSTDA